VSIDQRVGLARQRRDLDRKFALEPLSTAGTDVGDRIRNTLQRRKAETNLEDRRQQQHDRQRQERAAEIIVEGTGLIEDLTGVASDADQIFAVSAKINW